MNAVQQFEQPNGLIRQLHGSFTKECIAATDFTPPISTEDAMAREVVARIEEADGSWDSAAFRRHGCYDGDTEHRIALAAIHA